MSRRLRTACAVGAGIALWAGIAARRAADQARREDALWAAATDNLAGTGATERRSVRP